MAREYKDSGIEWIGQIPKEWKVSRLKFVLNSSIETGKRPNEPDGKILSIGGEHIQNGDFDLSHPMYVSESTYIGNKGKIKLNDTLVVKDGATIGKCMYVTSMPQEKMLLNEHVYRVSCSKFYYYWILSDFSQKWFRVRNQSTAQESITGPTILNIPVVVSENAEQQRVADYLDTKCEEIDSIIALQEKMIEELKAYKQSVITEAVTNGLNSNVPMKNSGIDWIGEVPEHWRLEPLKYCFGRRSEKNCPVKTKERLSLSIDKGVTLYAEKTTNLDRFKDDFTQYQIAYPNDIVLNCMNMIVGAVGLSNYMGCVSPVYYVIYPSKQDVSPLYYSYLLNIPTIRGVYYSLGKGIYAIERGEGRVNTCRLKVSYNDFGRLEIPVPPVKEQKAITQYIQEKCSEIDSLIAIKQQKISELKEYKKSVIYEYVTGKKEVV